MPFKSKAQLRKFFELRDQGKMTQETIDKWTSETPNIKSLPERIKQATSPEVATKTNPSLWEKAKAEAKSKMGGKHSARAMQLATQIYKKDGGGYSGKKPGASSNSLKKWQKEEWQPNPKAKRPDPGIAKNKDGQTTRYLPKKKWEGLSPSEARATDNKKVNASKQGQQFVSNTEKARVKTAIFKGFAKTANGDMLEYYQQKEKLKGGLGDGKKDSAFSKKELQMGIKVEKEHTEDAEIAKEVAKDHLTEHPRYYSALKKMEDELKKEAEESKPLYQPKPSTREGKKYQVYVKGDNGNPKLIHFGATGYKHNYSEGAKKNFRARHNCDSAQKDSAKWWACNYLWGKNQEVGSKTNEKLGQAINKLVLLSKRR